MTVSPTFNAPLAEVDPEIAEGLNLDSATTSR